MQGNVGRLRLLPVDCPIQAWKHLTATHQIARALECASDFVGWSHCNPGKTENVPKAAARVLQGISSTATKGANELVAAPVPVPPPPPPGVGALPEHGGALGRRR